MTPLLLALAQAQEVPASDGLSWPAIAGGVTAVLAGLSIVVGWVGWAVRRGRMRLEGMVAEVVANLKTSNGTSVAAYVERSDAVLASVRQDVKELAVQGERTEQLAARAHAVAEETRVKVIGLDARLTEHVATGHRTEE